MWQDLLKVTQILPKPNPKSSSLAKKDINWDFLPEFRPFRIPRLLLERVYIFEIEKKIASESFYATTKSGRDSYLYNITNYIYFSLFSLCFSSMYVRFATIFVSCVLT